MTAIGAAGGFGASGLLVPASHAADLRNIGNDKPNTWEEITTYNNFYEYSQEKTAIAELAKKAVSTTKCNHWMILGGVYLSQRIPHEGYESRGIFWVDG